MTDVDRLADAERRVREDLRRNLVPPPTPATLRAAVDRLAGDPPRAEPERRNVLADLRGRRLLEAIAGIAATVVLAAGLLAVLQVRNQGQVAASPHPTLPAVVASPLPSAAVKPTLLEVGAWLDPSTLWTLSRVTYLDQDQHLRISEDGGQTWSEPRLMAQPTDVGYGMFDADRGYSGMGSRQLDTIHLYLTRTSDGGRTWDPMVEAGTIDLQGGDRSQNAAQVHFSDPDHGVFLASSTDPATLESASPARVCRRYVTDDGGATWAAVPASVCINAGGVTWFSPTIGTVPTVTDAALSLTLDGGRTWTEGQLPVPGMSAGFRPLVVTASGDGLVRLLGLTPSAMDGAGQRLDVFESRDNGATWTDHYVPIGLKGDTVRDVSALDAQHWLAASEVESLGGMDLLESFDAGRTWTVASHADIQPGSPMRWLDRLHGTIQGVPIACQNGGSCGGDGTVLLTDDGGQTWHQVPF